MTVQVLLSSPASGKTHACIEAIRETLASQPLAPIWVIVGDHQQAANFRQTLASSGGSLGAQIATFGDICLEILERAERRIPTAPAALVHQLIRTAIDRANLQYYANLCGLPGFTLTVEGAIAEFKRSLISPEQLIASFSPDHLPRLELAQIYQRYQDLLDQIQWMDGEGSAWLAIEALEQEPTLLAECALLVVDGFDSFNPAQRRLLGLLAPRSARTLITLPGDPGWIRPVHRGFQTALTELHKDLAAEIIAPVSPVTLLEPLAYLEANLFETGKTAFPPKTTLVGLLETRSPAEEAREALRYLKARIRRDDVPIGGCAVLVPDPDQYFPHLRAAAVEFGLPVRFTQSRLLVQAPAIASLLNLLTLPLLNYPRRQVLDALRTPFFDLSGLGLTRREADTLDLVSRFGIVIEGLDQWDEVFAILKSREGSSEQEEDLEEESSLPRLPVAQAADHLHAIFRSFMDRIQPPAEPRTSTAWVTWLEDLLQNVCFQAVSLEASPALENQAVLSAFRECLRGMVLVETILGERNIAYPSFLAELQGLLQGSSYSEETDLRQEAVGVMRPIEARGLRFQAVVLTGLSEGIFPKVEHPDPLLDEDTRNLLGMQSRLERNQIGLFYQAVTRSDRFLLLTRPYLADSGDPWEPSPYWNAVKALFLDRVRQVGPEDARPLVNAASAQELLFWAVRREGLTGTHLSEESFAPLNHGYDQVRQAHLRLNQLLQDPEAFSEDEASSDGLVRRIGEQFGPEHTWSTSRLECYAACPFRFFVENSLAVEAHEPPGWDFDAAQLGSMLHGVLERTYRETGDRSDLAALLEKLRWVVPQEFAAAPAQYGFRPSPLWEAQQAELLERLEQTVVSLYEQSGGWQPLRFEQPFGLRGAPPLTIQVEGQIVRLHGVIDRIDVNETGELRVIDYKTGGSHLSPRDLIEGRRLQLGVYALAARDALGLGEPVEGFYWKIGPDGASSLKLSRFRAGELYGPQGAIALTREHLERSLSGLRRGAFASQPLGGKCPSYCGAAPWCWNYVAEWG
ncbi:MAG: PD-(D/E)XK nuclease family protein [Anaerolineaceae bacterium]|nr:PD-(D/E)XK nuclease family protein [Anaerolineaceae bacterium]